jgi:hypothetical protein
MKSSTAMRGLIAGAAGVAAMTTGEKVEQLFTHRPNSFVPARTLARLIQLPEKPDSDRRTLNWAMHWGQGILLGAGPRRHGRSGRPRAGRLVLVYEPTSPQRSDAGERDGGRARRPWTWPVDEQAVDLLHKAVYAFTTGAVADRLIAGPPGKPKPKLPWALRRTHS